ncbi:IclR family transcriptional regulator [Terrarubrum flagellatum]|uniref:IclR family transcriptional regulator n=1 Tax=Terrirubrum flagellatum TaxID=2895980 RepID=UPI003144E095
MAYTITAVDRALALLEALAEKPGIGVTEIANLTGNTKSLVFRLIYTLEKRGYVIKDAATRTYTLGYRPLYLAANAHDQLAVLRAADPFLDVLASRCDDNVNLIVRDGLNSVCVAVREALPPTALYAKVGRRGPLHVGGGPKIMLANAPKEIIDAVLEGPLERFTDATVTDPDAVRRKLDEIRASGVNESHGDLDPEAFSFAAAIQDASGEVVASVTIAGLHATLTEEKAQTYRRLVRDTAQRISAAMGQRPKLRAIV